MTPSERLIHAIYREELWLRINGARGRPRALVATAKRCGVKPGRVYQVVRRAASKAQA